MNILYIVNYFYASQTNSSKHTQSPIPDQLNPFGINNRGEPNWKLVSLILVGLILLIIFITLTSEILRPKENTPPLFPSPQPTFSPAPPTPTAINISNWNVYKNLDYGVAFKYPNNWYLSHNKPSTLSVTTTDPKRSGNLQGFWVIRYQNPNRLTLKEWMENAIIEKNGPSEDKDSIDKIILQYPPFQINNIPAFRLDSDTASQGQDQTNIFVVIDNLVYEIQMISNKEKEEQKILETILSSFIFLNTIPEMEE